VVGAAVVTGQSGSCWASCRPNDDDLHRDTGIKWRPIADTLRDTVEWMLQHGRLDPRWAPGRV
jgi:hypothetical protein